MSEVRNWSAITTLLSDPRFGEHLYPALPQNLAEKIKATLKDQQKAITRARNLVAGVSGTLATMEGGVSRQVRSIFCSLTADEKKAPEAKYWPLGALKMEEQSLFPTNALPEPQAVEQQTKVWEALRHEVEKLHAAYSGPDDLPSFLETLLLLLQRYTWGLPNAYGDKLADVSLYDHSRLAAALATAMTEPGEDGKLALLVGGGLSGIQDFIYTITARGATSALRGRSFYLQLLTEAAARYTLRRLDLPITSLIYIGGGHFYLIASPAQADELVYIQREISRVLFHNHRGELYLALAHQALREQDFYGGEIRKRWGALIDGIQIAKRRKFSELGGELSLIFEPTGHGGNREQQCAVCGQEHSKTDPDQDAITPDYPGGTPKCPACASFEELGNELRKARFLGFEHLPLQTQTFELISEPGKYARALNELGLHVHLKEKASELPVTENALTVLAMDDAARAELHPARGRALGRRFFVNVTPTLRSEERRYLQQTKSLDDLPQAGAIKPFDAMAVQAHGIPRLGVLRMDVDNLGKIFSDGFGIEANLSRIAALSFAVSLFFEGWVEVLAERRNQAGFDDVKRGERLYSIYSGGDDLFFVGAWDETVELSRQIRRDLGRYTGHAGIHASGGLVLADGKYPLAQAAEDAAKEEEAAKHLRWFQKGQARSKDALSFLGIALPWTQFGLEECESGLDNAHATMHLLTDMIEKGNTKRALLRKLVGIHARYVEETERRRKAGLDQNKAGETQTLWGPWMWLGYYFLSRMARDSHNVRVKDLAEKLKADDFRSMSWIGLAARWAELWLRE